MFSPAGKYAEIFDKIVRVSVIEFLNENASSAKLMRVNYLIIN